MEFSISLNDLQFFHTLGKGKWYTGSFGRVQLGLIKHLNQYVAVKIIKKSSVLCRKDIEHLLSEFSIMKLIKHPFIINLHGICQNRRYLCFILEYVPGGNLFHYLRTIGKLENSHACVYAAQMIIAIEYLHSIDIIYRDLKPENILISSDGYLKLADFGFAKSVENRTYTLCGTPEYTAPEIILHKGHGKSVD